MRLLTINTGSSSLKAAAYDAAAAPPVLIYSCSADGIGAAASRFTIRDAQGRAWAGGGSPVESHAAALAAFLEWLGGRGPEGEFDAAVHRLVVASARYLTPQELDADTLAELTAERRNAPDHLPQAIAAIETVSRLRPGMRQIGCSDSAFHATMPAQARTLALPAPWRARGVERIGYHGLSCASVLATLQTLDPAAAQGRLIVAHLGNGASITAIRAGRGVDTTMGMTPCGGLIMSSRSGDLDPGVVIYLQSQGVSAPEMNRLLNHQAGLAGISGTTGDMRTLLGLADHSPQARLAVACFVWQARKQLAAMAASLGGLDCLAFAGGIGENAAPVRAAICQDMEWMGLRLDAGRNARGEALISADPSPVRIRIVPTDENQALAGQGADWLRQNSTKKES